MLKKILISIAVVVSVVVGVFVIVVATRPAEFRVERSTTISAPPERAFSQVNDFRSWSGWSPWEKLDPNLTRSFSGPPSGTGASYAWVGNENVGEGRMTIEKSTPPSEVVIKLEFLKPWEATNTTVFSFTPEGAGTRVTWAMTGENNFASKAFSLFMDMDQLVGADFERGLAAMKSIAETSSE